MRLLAFKLSRALHQYLRRKPVRIAQRFFGAKVSWPCQAILADVKSAFREDRRQTGSRASDTELWLINGVSFPLAGVARRIRQGDARPTYRFQRGCRVFALGSFCFGQRQSRMDSTCSKMACWRTIYFRSRHGTRARRPARTHSRPRTRE